MRFSTIFAAAFAAVVSAADNAFTMDSGFSVTAGSPAELTWNPTTPGTVTLTLRSGNSGDLSEGTTIVANTPNDGSYTWTPPSDTPRGSDYTIEITSDSDPNKVNYSAYFILNSDTTGSPSSSKSDYSTSTSTKSSYSTTYTSKDTTTSTYMPHTTMKSNHSSTTTSRYTRTTGKATFTTSTKTTKTGSSPSQTSGGEGAPTGGAVTFGQSAGMLALAVAGAVVAL
jgi:hypothetical protein